jgi:Dynein heavy chain C-terminal domain
VNIGSLSGVKEETGSDVNPWRLFKTSEIMLAYNLTSKISQTMDKFKAIDLNSISDGDRNTLLTLSDNNVPYEWRKLWQGPKMASEFLKSVIVRIPTVLKFLDTLENSIDEIDFSKIFNVDSFLSTVKLVTSRDKGVSASNLTMESFTDSSQYEIIRNQQTRVIKIAPLLIDGLGFEKNMLVSTDNFNSNNFTGNIYIYYRDEKEGSGVNETNVCSIPLYSTYSREKLLGTIKLSTRLDKDEIIYSGTSLIVPSN